MAGVDPSEAQRRAVLREWWGGDEPIDLNRRVNLAAAFIERILRETGASNGLEEEQLRQSWSGVAGDFIARHTEPQSFRGGILKLRVLQPAMRFHLEQMKAPLLARLREELGEQRVQGIQFILG
jgi:predicted nucleic acid-binding Zn ribbon protein